MASDGFWSLLTASDEGHNLSTQLAGTKHVLLAPPRLADALRIHPKHHVCDRQSQLPTAALVRHVTAAASGHVTDVHSEPTAASPRALTAAASGHVTEPTAASPLAADVAPAASQLAALGSLAVLEPGDTLYVPPYWFHAVQVIALDCH